MEEIGGPSASLSNFRILYLITQMVGGAIIILVGSWIGVHLGGLAWTRYPSIQFNWHPLLMVIGMVFLYGNSILIYRGFRFARKKPLKIAHATIHALAFLLTVIALIAAFDSHNLARPRPIPNLYTLHSWVGLIAVILFGFQYLFGFVSYLYPQMKEPIKEMYMPIHIFFGLTGFVFAIVACLLGLLEKAIFSIPDYAQLSPPGVLVNTIGLLIIVFGGLVIYLATESSYKRQALPDDVILLTGGTSE
uniref:Putative non-vertebrate eumetazoan cytochrome b n=1 Tax=Corethrella appendiculata TaxID=1370023 RepID=U5ETM5_9DIPT